MVGLKSKHTSSLMKEEEDNVISITMKRDEGVAHSSQSLSIHVNKDYIFSNKFHVNDEDSEFLIMKSQHLNNNNEQVLESYHNDTARVVSRRKNSKGNHDDLKMKVDELEKIFADHKLRISASSVRRIDAYYGDDSRGKYYDKYMKKRDAKLREDWSMKREEKEARMKAMQDKFDQNSAEMKEKFSCSYHHAHNFTSLKSIVGKDQHPIDSLQNEDVGDLFELLEEKIYGQDSIVSESTFEDCAARQSKKNLPTAASVPNLSDLRKEIARPSFGMSKTNQYRLRNYARSKSTLEGMEGIKEVKPKRFRSLRKSISANPAELYDLAPLKFDMEKTDMNPYDQPQKSFLKKGYSLGPGVGGSAIGMENREFEGMEGIKEEKPKQSQSLRKSISANPAEFYDLAPLKVDIEKTNLNTSDKSRRSFLEKGYSLGPGVGGSAIRMVNREFDELVLEVEDSLDITKEEHEDHAYTNNGMPRLSQESAKSLNSGSEIGDSTRAISHMQHSFSYTNESSDIDASIDSPIVSPVSSNSHSRIQGETDDATARTRKKSKSARKKVLVAANSSISQPCKDVAKGFKRLLKFGRKTRGSESSVNRISLSMFEGDDKTEDRHRDLANRSSEDLRKPRMRFSHCHPSDNSFNESELLNEQVQSLRSSIPAPPASFKLRDDHISGSSLKAPRSCFSLSSFRSKTG